MPTALGVLNYDLIFFVSLFFCYVFTLVSDYIMPTDGEGRGGPDPLQNPAGDPGQRLLSAARSYKTDIRAAGLYEAGTVCSCLPQLGSVFLFLN